MTYSLACKCGSVLPKAETRANSILTWFTLFNLWQSRHGSTNRSSVSRSVSCLLTVDGVLKILPYRYLNSGEFRAVHVRKMCRRHFTSESWVQTQSGPCVVFLTEFFFRALCVCCAKRNSKRAECVSFTTHGALWGLPWSRRDTHSALPYSYYSCNKLLKICLTC